MGGSQLLLLESLSLGCPDPWPRALAHEGEGQGTALAPDTTTRVVRGGVKRHLTEVSTGRQGCAQDPRAFTCCGAALR